MVPHSDGETYIGRFSSLLAGSECPRPVYDEILFEACECVVTPTLGSIVPNWLLVIPRSPTVNFVKLQASGGTKPHDVINAILAKQNIDGSRVLWFEHGAAETGSVVGCGVDYAHLHILVDPPFTFDEFASMAKQSARLHWQDVSEKSAHDSVEPNASYLIAATLGKGIVAQNVESAGSQFFRRVIAELVQEQDAWNYRTHPHIENVRSTIRNFGGEPWHL